MKNTIAALEKKFQYVLSRVEEGPLSAFDEEELIDVLGHAKKHNSIWGEAIRNNLKPIFSDNAELIKGLAQQCRDDIFTMVCVLGQKGAILVMRAAGDE
jgi:hypothetical protein